MPQYRLFEGARLRYDRVRDQHVLLKAEEVTQLNGSAYEVLALCDGRSDEDIVAELHARYPDADLEGDVTEFLQEALLMKWVRVVP